MKRLTFILAVLFLLLFSLSYADTRIYDDNGILRYHIRDGRVYDPDGNLSGYLRNGKIYDRDKNLLYRMKGSNVYDDEGRRIGKKREVPSYGPGKKGKY